MTRMLEHSRCSIDKVVFFPSLLPLSLLILLVRRYFLVEADAIGLDYLYWSLYQHLNVVSLSCFDVPEEREQFATAYHRNTATIRIIVSYNGPVMCIPLTCVDWAVYWSTTTTTTTMMMIYDVHYCENFRHHSRHHRRRSCHDLLHVLRRMMLTFWTIMQSSYFPMFPLKYSISN